MTETHADNFDRANGAIDSTPPWDDMVSLAKPQINANRVVGTGDNNCRGVYETAPSASRAGQYFKVDITGINNRAGLIYNASSGSDSSWAVLTNPTTLILGATASTSSSNSGTTHSTITVPTVTPPKEMLAMFTSDNTVDIYIDRVLAGTHTLPNLYGHFGGIYVRDSTDIVDNYEQGTWAA